MEPRQTPPSEAVRAQLERILASAPFANSTRSQRFLRFVVEGSIRNQEESLKEYVIAVEVFDRDSSYDPAVDATVRVEAGRLRTRLRDYYAEAGRNDLLLIEIPKGSYHPIFTERAPDIPRGGHSADVTQTGHESDGNPPDSLALTAVRTERIPSTAEGNGRGAMHGSQTAPARAAKPASNDAGKVRRRALFWISLLAPFSLAVALSVWGLIRWQEARTHVLSLAVLPLQNLSGDPGQDYFAAGMTDELTTELARINGLRVVSRTSAIAAARSQESLPQIAEALKVDAIVEGSILRSGNEIRITAQLIDARSDKHLWAQSFEGQANAILSLQDTVAREIATRTQAVLTAADRARLSSTRSIKPEAYDDYLRGLYFIQRREGERAAHYFQSALDLEPTYSPAWSGLAQALLTEETTDRVRAGDVMPSAIGAAERAVKIDPDNGEAYIGLGSVEFSYLRDWPAAQRDLRRGIELSPSDPLGYIYLSIYLTIVNRSDEAVAAARRAMNLDPLGFFTNREFGQALYYDRRYDESLAALRRAAEIAPDRPALVDGWTSAIAEVQGRYADAVDAELRGIGSQVSPGELRALRAAFAAGGWKSYQQTRIRFLLRRSTTPCTSGGLAMSYLRLGEVSEAFRWFQREADEHCVFAIQLAADPRLDAFRHDPHYLGFQDRLNLPH